MSKQDMIRMAREAGFEADENDVWITDGYWLKELERFAILVAIQERERAALKVEELGMIGYSTLAIAAAIRKGDQE
jgi:hypothetical protein